MAKKNPKYPLTPKAKEVIMEMNNQLGELGRMTRELDYRAGQFIEVAREAAGAPDGYVLRDLSEGFVAPASASEEEEADNGSE